MTLASLLALVAALALFVATPGPGIMAIVSCAIGRGFPTAAGLAIGLVAGDLFYLSLALFGLGLIAKTLGVLFLVVKFAGAAYLIWLGVGLWRAPPKIAEVADGERRGVLRSALSGLGVGLGNPKVIGFYLGVLPAFVDIPSLTMRDSVEIIVAVALVVGSICLIYAWLAVGARRFLTSPSRIRLMNRTAGTVMIGSGIAIAVR
jgi:threonine/homoserine/homoserine lactone efflux protein